ncbi:MAG: ankyrin repeat domain-containing protein [Actinomycetaceae bacterium]|nr:ankyrin repeat domain-containing protein [Actinomycetaceae bacterium]
MYTEINQQDHNGNTALHHAAVMLPGKSEQETQRLLNLGATPDIQNVFGNTPLMLAAMVNNNQTMRLLIDSGANMQLRNLDGMTAIELLEERISAGERMLARF